MGFSQGFSQRNKTTFDSKPPYPLYCCDVSVAGKLFHTRAPATAKARSPRVRRRVKLVKQGNNTACITCVRYAVVTSSSAIAKTAHVALLTLVISIYRASAY